MQRCATHQVTALILSSVGGQALGCGFALAPMSGSFGRLLLAGCQDVAMQQVQQTEDLHWVSRLVAKPTSRPAAS